MFLIWPHPSSKGKEYRFKETCPESLVLPFYIILWYTGTQIPCPCDLSLPPILLASLPCVSHPKSKLSRWYSHHQAGGGGLKENCGWDQGWSLDAQTPCLHASRGVPYIMGWMQWWTEKGSRQQATDQGPQGQKMAFFVAQIHEESKHSNSKLGLSNHYEGLFVKIGRQNLLYLVT